MTRVRPTMSDPTAAPTPIPPVKKRKAWPWVLLVLLVVLAAGGYFGALPYFQLKQYKDQAAHRHQALVLAVKPFVDSFLNDVASDDTSTTEQTLKDLDQDQSYIKAAQDLLKSDREALTSFKPWPLLDKTYPGYHDMMKTAELEKSYVNTADTTLTDAQNLTAYAKDLLGKTQELETLGKKTDTLSSTDTKVLAGQLDGLAADMQVVLDKVKTLQAPADMKTFHDKTVSAFTDMVGAMKDLAKGVRALDVKGVNDATAKIEKASKALDDAGKQFEKDFPTTSQMSKNIATLRDLEKQIKY